MGEQIQNLGSQGLKIKIKNFFSQEFFQSGIVHWVFIGALILNVVNWGLIAYFIRPVDFPIILHYNVYFGVDVIGDWWQVYYLPLIGLLIWREYNFWAIFLSAKERIVAIF